MQTNIRSLMGAISRTLNLINPEMQYHHEQTAYLAYQIAQELGLVETELFLALNASLLHDIGEAVTSPGLDDGPSFEEIQNTKGHFQEAETREQRKRIARIGANMLRDIDAFRDVATIIAASQDAYVPSPDPHLRIAQIIHLADCVATALSPSTPVLNQVGSIVSQAQELSGTEFCPDAVEALVRVSTRECMWLDLSLNPTRMLADIGPLRVVPIENLVIFTSLISRVIDFRSPFTAMHSAGVAATARELARLAGMSDQECQMMQVAGNLHDIGKLRVPNSILEKPGRLTTEEFNVIREHTYYTNMILQDVEGFELIAKWAAHHHEKLNGTGYPFHLTAEALDEGSRIMAVADIFSALTEVRPYRKGMDKEQVKRILTENVARGEICHGAVSLLMDHYDEVDAVRDERSRVVGRRYFESLELEEPTA